MNRIKAREMAMQAIFQMEAQHNWNIEEIIKDVKNTNIHEALEEQEKYVVTLLTNMCENKQNIDDIINEKSEGWPVNRMGKADLAIIRMAITEILYLEDIPRAISINEAVNLAKVFGTDKSPAFINSVLGKIEE